MSKAKEKHQCCGQVWNSYSHRFTLCPHRGKVEREGKWFCGTHDPVKAAEKKKAKEDERRTKRQADEKQRQARFEAGLRKTLATKGLLATCNRIEEYKLSKKEWTAGLDLWALLVELRMATVEFEDAHNTEVSK